MDFERVLTALLDGFEREGIRYASMGGLALGLLGVPRATRDLDFLVHAEDLGKVRALMGRLGYRMDFQSANVSQYRHDSSEWGHVDFLHALRRHSLSMLDRARPGATLPGGWAVRVLQPEDVIGLKVQAMANDPLRKAKEVADIESLADRFRQRLDWARIEEYYRLFQAEGELADLRRRFDRAE